MLCLGRFVAVGSCSSSYRLAGSCLLTNTRHAAKARSLPTKQASVRLLSVTAVDHASQPDIVNEAVVSTLADGAKDLTEVSFTELGLAHAYPSGWIQAVMEVLHVDCGLTWCATIATSTILLRLLIFPVMVKQRRAAVINNNIAPEVQRVQMEMSTATDPADKLRLSKKFNEIYAKQGISPFDPIKPVFFSGFAFTSMFFGIRGMAGAPVPSMTMGGLGWFTDLTVADPIYLLPVLTASTLAISIHINAEGAADSNTMPPMLMTFFKIMPWISLPVMTAFPAALNLYWLINNIITLGQATLLRQKSVRERLGIGELIKWRDEDLPLKNNPFAYMGGGGKDKKSLVERIKEEQVKEDERRRSGGK